MAQQERQIQQHTELPKASVFAQLAPTPRIFLFFGVMVVPAMSLGAKEVGRWQYLNEAFDSALSLGLIAAMSAITLAVTSLFIGRVIDRNDPRPFVMVALFLGSIMSLSLWLGLISGTSAAWVVAVSAVVEGFSLGLAGPAFLKVQAAFVRPGAEGAAEIVNILRLGLGIVIGSVLAGLSPSLSTTFLFAGASSLIAIVPVWFIMRPVTLRESAARNHTSDQSIVAYLGARQGIRTIVTVDLVLAFVIPTQLVNLVLFDQHLPDLASLSIASGAAGVLLGRFLLAVLGFRGRPAYVLLGAVVGLAIIQLFGAVSLTDGWLFSHLVVLPLIIIVGSMLGTYAQGLVAALAQQKVDEAFRGRLSGLLIAGRNVLIALGAIIGSLMAVWFGSQILLAILGVGLIIVVLVSRGFRALPG
jgi:ENTS family enterobactin (siderophore) exporter